MRPQINRLPASIGKGLAGTHIDRGRIIRFTLDGRVVSGYAGDTVLSALLASGVDTLGAHEQSPLGLRSAAAPAIIYSALGAEPHHALPMARTPARDGAEYSTVTTGPKPGLFTRLFQPGRTLGLTVEGSGLVRPWRALHGKRLEPVDLVVVGGGVAGMAAALAGAHAGLSVTLVEATSNLGGHSGLFGTQDGDSTPEDNVASLAAEIAAAGSITVRTMAEAFAIGEGLVRVHALETAGDRVEALVLDLPARHIVLATGALERLPVFPGNRLPGVSGAQEAFELARRYGVWPGQSWLLATSSNPAYRLPTLLAESAIALDRILDARDRASSRFIEFCKAYGIRQFPGTFPLAARTAGNKLTIHLPHDEAILVDRLVVCGGFQPDLTLWHMAGGESRWNAQGQRLEPVGEVANLVLAGSAAGVQTRRGCVTSGIDAVDRLLGRAGKGIDDPVIDAVYETPDQLVVSPETVEGEPPSYLDADETLMMTPVPPRRHWSRLFGRRSGPVRVLSEAPQPLSIGAICAGVGLGLIPPESAGVVAQERVALVPLAAREVPVAPAAVPTVPAYLADRFGPGASVVTLVHDASRQIGSGTLAYEDEDMLDPRHAVGVVLRSGEGKTEALVSAHLVGAGRPVILRDLGQTIRAEIRD